MTLTIAPSEEACQALVDRINAGGTGYLLDATAVYSRVLVDPLEEITGLRVDVVHDKGNQPAETLDGSDNSSHQIKVWIRAKLPKDHAAAIPGLELLRRQIFLQLDNWKSSNRRVQVWECDEEEVELPSKAALRQEQLYVTAIPLRVEVIR